MSHSFVLFLQVYLGSGIYLNEKAWNEKIRKQSQDTIMVKDIAQGVWGKEQLAKRTVDKRVEGKSIATPKKVRVITGRYISFNFELIFVFQSVEMFIFVFRSS